jgi:phosphatidate cytidylyltransferase
MKTPGDAYLVLAGLGSVLIAASAIGFFLHWRTKDEKARATVENLNARIRAWWGMVIVLSGASLAGRNTVIALFALLSFGALREFVTLTPTRRSDHAALFASFFVVLPAQYGLIWAGWYGLYSVFIPVYAFLILPALAVLSADAGNFLTRTAETQWGLMLCVYCISYVPAVLMLAIPGYENRSVLLMAFLVIVVQSSDVLQYVFGKLFGRHKIAPEVSPGKTVEGFAGGIAGATAVGAALWWITPFNRAQAAAMALGIALMGFLGGLVLSAIKRDRGIKDWGQLIEGHGGILDRLDSLCFSAPIFFHLTRYFFAP